MHAVDVVSRETHAYSTIPTRNDKKIVFVAISSDDRTIRRWATRLFLIASTTCVVLGADLMESASCSSCS